MKKAVYGQLGGSVDEGEKMGQIGVLSTTLGDIWENVGDFSKNVGVFSKNVGDFRRIMPWYQGEIKTDERRECEGCESKKCKIAVGRAYVREEGVFHSATRGWWHLLCYPITNLEKWRKTDRLDQNKKSLREIELAKGAVYCDAILLNLKSRLVK